MATPLPDDLALAGGTVYTSPTHEPLRDGVVLVRDGTIAAVGPREQVRIPEQARSIDCAGRAITAGFWNSHVHFMERKWSDAATISADELARQVEDMLTRYGFTAAFDLSSPWENTRIIRDRIESGEVRGPRIYSTGLGLLPKNSAIPPEAVRFMGWMPRPATEVADPEEASAASKKLLDEGVDAIKLFVSAPSRASLSERVIEAAVRESHTANKPVFAHCDNAGDVLTAVRGGVDIIAHTTPFFGPWDETLLTAMKEHHVALTPTLWIWKWYSRHDRRSAQDKVIETELRQLRSWVETGGTVLFGTDLGAVDPDPTEEYALMSQAGMNYRQILESLTTAPAERFGQAKQTARISAGFQADLVVLRNDPADNVLAFAEVQYTIRKGKVIYRDQ